MDLETRPMPAVGDNRELLAHFLGGFLRASDSRAQSRPDRSEEETRAIANVASA